VEEELHRRSQLAPKEKHNWEGNGEGWNICTMQLVQIENESLPSKFNLLFLVSNGSWFFNTIHSIVTKPIW
jgi:hypothetical protein